MTLLTKVALGLGTSMVAGMITYYVINYIEDQKLQSEMDTFEKAVYFNFGTHDIDKIFSKITLFIGSIVNRTDQILDSLELVFASGDSITVIDITSKYRHKSKIKLNYIKDNNTKQFLSKIISSNLALNSNDSFMVVVICKDHSIVEIIEDSIKAIPPEESTIKTLLTRVRDYNIGLAKRDTDSLFLATIVFLLFWSIYFLIALLWLQRKFRKEIAEYSKQIQGDFIFDPNMQATINNIRLQKLVKKYDILKKTQDDSG